MLERNRIINNTGGRISAIKSAQPELDRCGRAGPDSCPPAVTCSEANTIKGGGGFRVSNLDPGVTIDAECTYWGNWHGQSGVVNPNWFYGAVDYTPYLTGAPIPAAP